jgi:tRNA A-37 threonylcarbamoyl transferase component Bud32
MNELLGHYVGRYHIVEQLGAGGMATVYKAYDSRLERDVAVKFIRSDIVKDEMFLKRFEREAKALARLSHPYIVKVLDYGEHEGSPYLVMEYIRGDTLKGKLGRPIPWREACRMLIPVADALDYTHKQNIVHRDVKPSNFLVSDSNHLMLSDFGIAKMLDTPEAVQLTGTGVGIGTPEYMAPEQGLGQIVDQRADLYSLGIVFYEMLTGQKPYRADTPMAVMFKQISDPLPPPHQFVPNLPEGVEHILVKALAKKPEDRYQDMAAFAKALQDQLEVSDGAATLIAVGPTLPGKPALDQAAPRAAEHAVVQNMGSSFPRQPEATFKPAETAPKANSKKIWITCGVLALAAVCVGVVAVTGGFGALMAIFGPPPEGLAVNISVPPMVEMGREFQTVVTLRNEGDKEIKVTEIQVPKVLLDIAALNATTPLYNDSIVYNSTDTTGYKFNLSIAPGSSTEVRFHFMPRQTADVTGEWDVLVGTRRATTALHVIIVDAVAQAPSSTTAPSNTPQPSSTPPSQEASVTTAPTTAPTTASDWSLVWEDDFSDAESGFFVGESADRAFWYEGGEYRIEVRQSNWLAWTFLGYELYDIQLSIDMRVQNGTGSSAYGLLCRQQGEGNFYGFEFSEDGYYTIWLRNNGEYTNLVEWTYDERLNSSQWQQMTIECLGENLSLLLNGEVLVSASDATLTYGDVGLLAESDDTGGSILAYDNFSLFEQ